MNNEEMKDVYELLLDAMQMADELGKKCYDNKYGHISIYVDESGYANIGIGGITVSRMTLEDSFKVSGKVGD